MRLRGVWASFNEAAALRRGVPRGPARAIGSRWRACFNEAAALRRGVLQTHQRFQLCRLGFNEAAALRRGVPRERVGMFGAVSLLQ